MLIHAVIASRVDYCNCVLFQTAAVHLRPLQLVMNAAARHGCEEEEVRQHYADSA